MGANRTKRDQPVQVHLRLSGDVLDRIREFADADNRTLANMVLVLLVEAVEQRTNLRDAADA